MTNEGSERFRLLCLYELPTARRGVILSAERRCANAQRLERTNVKIRKSSAARAYHWLGTRVCGSSGSFGWLSQCLRFPAVLRIARVSLPIEVLADGTTASRTITLDEPLESVLTATE